MKFTDALGKIAVPKVVRVSGEFSESSANALYTACDEAAETGQRILPILIDSYGGSVYALNGMIDYFQSFRDSGIEIVTIACGKAMSAGSALFCMGDRRYIGKRSTLMFHRVFGAGIGNPSEVEAEVTEMARLEKLMFAEISKTLNYPKTWLYDQLKKRDFSNWYVDANDAVSLKIATHIGIPKFEFQVSTNFVCK